MSCLFCKIARKEVPADIIYEDDDLLVFLDLYPDSNGHTLIIPKKHYQDIKDIPLHTLNQIYRCLKRMYPLLQAKLKFDGLTISQNNEYGQEIKHYHLHLLPKYKTKQPVLSVKTIYELITK